MLAWLWMACSLPTTMGLGTDGYFGPPGTAQIGLNSGAAIIPSETPAAWGFADVHTAFTVGDGAQVVTKLGSVPAFHSLHGEAEARFSTSEAYDDLGATLLMGGGFLSGSDHFLPGFHVGAVVGDAVAPHVRVFGGGKVNPVFGNGRLDAVWCSPTVGVAGRFVDDHGVLSSVGLEVGALTTWGTSSNKLMSPWITVGGWVAVGGEGKR